MAARAFDLILFDLGNTLIYYDGDEANSSALAARELTQSLITLGYPLQIDDFSKDFQTSLSTYFRKREQDCLELTAAYVLREELTEAGFTDIPAAHIQAALKAMYSVSEPHWKLGDDTYAALHELKGDGYRLGVVSNAADADDFHRLVENHALEPYFELLLVSAEVGIRKPHPLIFNLAIDFFEVSPERSAMVGDLLAMDVLGAQRAGLTSIWITRWLQNPSQQADRMDIQPDASVTRLSQLPALLKRLN
jgi:HAD superfamily hydrolase (TIGR01662 family)